MPTGARATRPRPARPASSTPARSGLRRIVSLIYVDNPRSEAVARRLGMSPERELLWAGLPHRMWSLRLGARAAAG